jgi:hypothetical protein
MKLYGRLLSRARNVNSKKEGQHILAKNGGTIRRFVNLASAFWNWTNAANYPRRIARTASGLGSTAGLGSSGLDGGVLPGAFFFVRIESGIAVKERNWN